MANKKGNLAVLITHLSVGQSLASAARAANMSVSTAQRRIREPAVQSAIQQAYADYARQAASRFRDLRSQAQDRLGELLAGPQEPSVTLRAIEIALRYSSAADSAWVHEMLTTQLSMVSELKEQLGDGKDFAP